MPSAANFLSRREADRLATLTFFLDYQLGRYTVADKLRASGARVEVHIDHFDQAAPDTEWIPEIGRCGWVLITRDKNIRRNPLERAAYEKAKVRGFVLTAAADISGHAMGDLIVACLPGIIRRVAGRKGPLRRPNDSTKGQVVHIYTYVGYNSRKTPFPIIPMPSDTFLLSDSDLLRRQAYINGQWCEAESGHRFPVLDPATGTHLADVPDMGAADARRAIDAARDAWPSWRATTPAERARLLRRWHDLIRERVEDLALLMTSEQGKPLAESVAEVLHGAAFVEWFAEEARRAYGDFIPSSDPTRRTLVMKEPVGVAAAITPWNFPNAMITRKVAPALAAGCTVVLKPAEDTPLSALALAELADRAGFPPGVFNVVTASHGAEVGEELATNNIVRKVSFTGSTAVGKRLMALAAGNVKKLSLELGGNAPFIVFDDADLEAAVAGAVISKFRNSGQTCICANRIFVQKGIYDRFVERFVAAVRALKVGDGRAEGVTQGPLINESALHKVKRLVGDAVAQGARVLTGGKPHALGRTFFEPTVLVDATPAMVCFDEEIFGPVAALYRFRDEREALDLANRTPYGLASYVYTQDYRRIARMSEALEYGMVGVNVPLLASELAPFGGIKESGVGREGSKYGMDEYLELKYVCLGGL